ncbi:hypothetical protein FMN52_00810 [Marinobacter sp. BW6]|uniref:hypothetical protein n=1 Tax=Marinobacter sp. BW6 TaxID=2592624 RepID=UPI0011DE9169|nr:hypothetical protein [Marinobacter sp. BW6]TYC63797.1 hypothetical protein FMN52_00810 [Marinobacter sp. BW6]
MAVKNALLVALNEDKERIYLSPKSKEIYMSVCLCAETAEEALAGPFCGDYSELSKRSENRSGYNTVILLGTYITQTTLDVVLKNIKSTITLAIMQKDLPRADRRLYSAIYDIQEHAKMSLELAVEDFEKCIYAEDPHLAYYECKPVDLGIDKKTPYGDLETIAENVFQSTYPPMHPYDLYMFFCELKESES